MGQRTGGADHPHASVDRGPLAPAASARLHQGPPAYRGCVSAEPTRSGLSWDAVDLAILYGDAAPNDSNCEPFIDELIQPLCSPNILRHAPIKRPADLLEHVLIHTNYNAVTWKDWFAEHGVTGYTRHRRNPDRSVPRRDRSCGKGFRCRARKQRSCERGARERTSRRTASRLRYRTDVLHAGVAFEEAIE